MNRAARLRSLPRRHPVAVTVAGTAVVAGALAITLVGKRDEFGSALHTAPFWVLGLAVVLHLVWLVARSEAWHVCIRAAGGSVGRRPLFRAASVGYLGNLCNGQFGAAVRIAALRKSAPADSPRNRFWLRRSSRYWSSKGRSRVSCRSPSSDPWGCPGGSR
jgi:uncharacterized membrane protein YbhN (UPF0104 family)